MVVHHKRLKMADSLLAHLEKLLERICFWRGFAFGEDLLHISDTTWPVLSSRSSSFSAVTLSMLSLLQFSPKTSLGVQARAYQPFQDDYDVPPKSRV